MKENERFRFIILVNERNQEDLFEVHSQEGEDLKLIKDQCYELFLRNTKLAHPDTLPSKSIFFFKVVSSLIFLIFFLFRSRKGNCNKRKYRKK